jgi:hypothetical protein
LVSDLDALDAGVLDGLFQVLGKKLLLLVEVVAGTLRKVSIMSNDKYVNGDLRRR